MNSSVRWKNFKAPKQAKSSAIKELKCKLLARNMLRANTVMKLQYSSESRYKVARKDAVFSVALLRPKGPAYE
jgi:hypothetical protein